MDLLRHVANAQGDIHLDVLSDLQHDAGLQKFLEGGRADFKGVGAHRQAGEFKRSIGSALRDLDTPCIRLRGGHLCANHDRACRVQHAAMDLRIVDRLCDGDRLEEQNHTQRRDPSGNS
jgi:hypothetical protein